MCEKASKEKRKDRKTLPIEAKVFLYFLRIEKRKEKTKNYFLLLCYVTLCSGNVIIVALRRVCSKKEKKICFKISLNLYIRTK